MDNLPLLITIVIFGGLLLLAPVFLQIFRKPEKLHKMTVAVRPQPDHQKRIEQGYLDYVKKAEAKVAKTPRPPKRSAIRHSVSTNYGGMRVTTRTEKSYARPTRVNESKADDSSLLNPMNPLNYVDPLSPLSYGSSDSYSHDSCRSNDSASSYSSSDSYSASSDSYSSSDSGSCSSSSD